MDLIPIPATHIDQAWRDGAHELAQACATSGGEITGDQLKLILARGERILLQMRDDHGSVVGWAAVRVDQYPNLRAIHVCELYAPHGEFHRFVDALKGMARAAGCSEIRCAAGEAQARLYRQKCGFEPIYTTMRLSV